MPKPPRATYFASVGELRTWFEANASGVTALQLGFYKKATGVPSVTYREALDEALCVGWIDGVRHRVDDKRYTIRFTPRKPGSYWSQVNIGYAERLIASGRMRPEGLAAFEKREESAELRYAYENRPQELPEEYRARFEKDPKAWEFFASQPPSYRKAVVWWVVSAKREETREKRLAALIADSANHLRVAPLRPRVASAKKGK